MKLLDIFASTHNWLADKDFIWWPFSFLRPEKNEDMTFKTTLTMTACFGGLTFLMFAVFAVMNNVGTFENLFLTLVFSFLGFFLWFNLITKPLWNHRSKKLAKNLKK